MLLQTAGEKLPEDLAVEKGKGEFQGRLLVVAVSILCPQLPCASVVAGDFQSQVKILSGVTQVPVSTRVFPSTLRDTHTCT